MKPRRKRSGEEAPPDALKDEPINETLGGTDGDERLDEENRPAEDDERDTGRPQEIDADEERL